MTIIPLTEAQNVYVMLFGAGVLFQTVLTLGKRIFTKNFLICLVGGILFGGAFGSSRTSTVYIGNQFFWAFTVFIVLLALTFKKIVQPVINERILFQMLIILFYAIFVSRSWENLFLFLILFTIGAQSIINNVRTTSVISYNRKLAYYIWFLIAASVLVIFQFGKLDITFFWDPKVQPIFDIEKGLQIFLSGMVVFPIVANASYIFEMVPIPSKNKPWEEVKAEAKLARQVMVSKFNDYQVKLKESLLILLFQGGFLFINLIVGIFDKYAAIMVSLLLVETAVYFRFDYWKALAASLSLAHKPTKMS